MKLTYENAGRMLMYSGGNPWQTPPPNNSSAKWTGVIVGVLMGAIGFGVSQRSDWPGNFFAAIVGGVVIGGITYAGVAK